MSVHIVSWAWQQTTDSAGAKLVLIKLADQANDDGICWPGQDRLAQECQMSTRSVQRHIDELVAQGLLEVKRRGRNVTNVYHLKRDTTDCRVSGHLTRHGDARDTTPVSYEPSVRPTRSEETNVSSSRRDELFEAVYEAWIGRPYEQGVELTKDAASRIGMATSALRAVDATPEQVRERAAEYRRAHPEWVFTPQALTSWWPTLESKRERIARRFA